jgi:hypothetical protein
MLPYSLQGAAPAKVPSKVSLNFRDGDFLGNHAGAIGQATVVAASAHGAALSAGITTQIKETNLEVPPVYFTSPLDSVDEREKSSGGRSMESQTRGDDKIARHLQGQGAMWNFTSNSPNSQQLESSSYIIPKKDMRGMIQMYEVSSQNDHLTNALLPDSVKSCFQTSLFSPRSIFKMQTILSLQTFHWLTVSATLQPVFYLEESSLERY